MQSLGWPVTAGDTQRNRAGTDAASHTAPHRNVCFFGWLDTPFENPTGRSQSVGL
ncbi:hypothetical protein VITFI_CDS2532 [Vitreoscilla filiformis]|uniref:Uncharacterized protein n=1 Tax=Vitreoscilla filiformis TaxID=63 RepID=A0A221KHA2_VITFI|nr:hypothetical protein VITFI_CDS2532 [Vitreoscilla filiformis]